MSDAVTPTSVLGTSWLDPTVASAAGSTDVTRTAAQDAADAATARQTQVNRLIRDTVASPKFDRTTGAPALWVATVSDYSRPDQQLQVLRDLQAQAGMRPDAIPYGDGNFIYTDPRTQRPTLFQPGFLTAPGKSIAGWAGTAGEIGGAVLGALGGTFAGGPAGGVAGAGAGAAGGREAVGGLLRAATGTTDPRTTGQVLTDVGTTAALNAAGQALIPGISKLGEAIPSLRGEAAPPLRTAIEAAAARGEAAPVSNSLANIRAQDALNQRYGENLNITAGALSESPSLSHLENVSAFSPASSIPQQWNQSIETAGRLADRIGLDISGGGGANPTAAAMAPTVGKQATGDVLQDSAQGLIQGFQQRERQMMGDVLNAAPDARIQLQNVERVRDSLYPKPGTGDINFAAKQDALQTANGILSNALTPGGSQGGFFADLGSALQLRTNLGQEAFGTVMPGTRTPGSQQYMQELYNALNTDIRGGINDTAAQLLNDHDQYVQMMRDPTSQNLDMASVKDLGRLATKAPDALAQSMISGNPAAGRQLSNLINRMVSEGQTDQANQLMATIFRNIGAPTPGATGAAAAAQFSLPVFATKWAALPDSVKTVFQQNMSKPLYAAINDLAQVAKAQQSASRFYNFSQSGNTVNAMLMAKGGIGAAASLLGGHIGPLMNWIGTYFGGPKMIAMMQNPTFVRWLAGTARQAAVGRPGWMANAAGRLGAVGLNPADHAAIQNMLTGNQQ